MKILRRSLFALVCFAISSAGFAAVGVNKSFSPNSVVSTQSSTLTLVLLNPNSAQATSVALTDPLPSGVVVASPLVVGSNTCGFSTAAVVAGGGSIPLSGGTIPALSGGVAGQCQIQIDVVASTANTYLNTIAAGAVSSSQGTNSQAAQATLVVSAPINVTASKAFAPTNVHGDLTAPLPSTLTITLTNPNAIALTSAAITDSLPAAITIATPSNAATTCNGVAPGTATASSPATNPATIALSGGTIPANGACTLSVAVVARNPNALVNGNQTNTIAAGALTTTQGVTSPAIAANINVQTGASVTKAFAPAIIASGGASTMTITYTNFNTNTSGLTPLSPITFTDTFPVPPGMLATALPTTTCGGTISTVPAQPSPGPYTSFTLTGGSLAGVASAAAGSTSCIVTAPVTAVSTGTNSLAANNFGGVVIGSTSGTLSVSAITGSKSFTTPALQTGSTTMTVTLNNLTAAPAVITAFTDNLATMGAGFTVGGAATDNCGGTITAAVGATSVTEVGGTIPATGSCTLVIPIAISATAATGNRTNTIAVGGVHTTAGNNTVTITGAVNVQRALTESKAFSPATIQGGASSRLTVTMAPTVNLTGAGFTDDLTLMGAGFVVAPIPNAVATNCTGGTVTANAGATSFALAGASLTAGSNCTVAVNIATPASTGTFTNHIPAANFTTTQGVTNGDTSANLVLVNASVTVNKSFSPTTVPIGNTTAGNPNFSTLSIQIRNNNAGAIALTGVGLTDVFPTGMVVANPANAAFSGTGCSGATITAPVGATQLVLSGASVNANAICTVSVRVVGTISGNLIDNIPTGSISDAQGVTNPLQGTATLAVTGTVNLTITKADGVTSVIPGTTTTYTIGVSNAGPNDVTGLGVNDTPPAGMSFSSWTCAASAGSACPASGSGPIATNVTVLHGGSVTFTVLAAIASGATGSITNTASLAVPGSVIDTNPVTSASDTDTLTPQADLAITKTDGVTSVVPGTSTTYTIVVNNNGPSDAPGATVADVLLGGAIASATWTCSASPGSSCPASGSGDINVLVDLLAGGSATFTVTATISTTAIGSVANTATVTAPAGVTDTNLANNSATDTDTLTPQADLAITKTDGVGSVNAGGSTTYTIVASNNGPSAVTGATVADSAPPNMTFGSWTCAASPGSGCPASGSGNISASVNLLVGGKATFTVPATVSGTASGTIANTATIAVPLGVTDTNGLNNSATDTDTVTPTADLAITKTDGVASVVPGTTTTYTIVVTNNGPSNVAGAKVSDLLPPSTVTGDTFTAVATGSATGFTASGTGNINDTVNLPNGSTITYTVVASISASATGSLSNTATVTAPAGVNDPNLANNSATDTDTLTPQVDLAITKTDGVTSVVPGTTTTYTIVVTNNGPSDVTGAAVTDTMLAGVGSDSFTATASGGASGFSASGTGNINDTVNMPAGSTITYTLQANIASNATGSVVNTANVTAPSGVSDTNPSNNSATDTDTLTPQVTLVVVKTDGSANYTPGGTAIYTVTVTDTGASDAANVTVSDPLPLGVTLTSGVTCVANGSASCGAVTGGIGETSFGTTGATVGAGASNSLVFTVPVAFAAGMTTNPLANTATATDLVTNATASDTDSDALAPQVTLAVTKDDGSTSYTPGGTATYTVTVTHGGVSDATNVTVTDALPAGVTLTANASCVANGGASCGTVSGLTGQTSFGATGASIAAGPGNSLVFTVPVAFAASMTIDPLINTATATDAVSGANGSGSDSDARSAQVSLAVLKTDGSPSYTPGGTATYTITVTDTGVTDALDVSVDDALPTGVTLTGTVICAASGSATCGTVTGNAGQASFSATGATIGAGGGNSLVFTVPVAFASDLADNPLVNAASAKDLASGASGSGSDTDVLAAQASLTVTKDDGSTTYTPGGGATYTIVVTNAGPSDAMNTTVSDPLPSGATLSANASCVAAGTADCGTSTGTTGQTSFGTTGASIPAGAGNSLTFTAPVAFASTMTANPLLNTVTVTDPASASPATATDSDTLNADVDLAITKTDGVTTAVPGQTVTYTIVVSNTGPSDAVGATVADALPAAIASDTWTCAAIGGGSCTASGAGNISDTVNVPVGATLTYTLLATIAPDATGMLANTATVRVPAGATDTNPGNNSATDTDTLAPQADLAITKTDGVTTVSPGGALTYTIVASNAGPSAVSGATVADTAPAGLTLGSWTCSASPGSACPATGSGNISASVDLLVGGNATFTVNATVGLSATGSIANTATISAPAGVTDPNPGDNSATDTDTITLGASLALAKTDGSATYAPGGTATYTITVTNGGPAAANSTTVTDNLPSGVTLTAAPTCVAIGTATCGSISGLAGGTSFTATAATLAAGAGNRLVYSLPVRFATTLNTPTLTNTASAADPASATLATGSDTDTLAAPGRPPQPVPGNDPRALALLAAFLLLSGWRWLAASSVRRRKELPRQSHIRSR